MAVCQPEQQCRKMFGKKGSMNIETFARTSIIAFNFVDGRYDFSRQRNYFFTTSNCKAHTTLDIEKEKGCGGENLIAHLQS